MQNTIWIIIGVLAVLTPICILYLIRCVNANKRNNQTTKQDPPATNTSTTPTTSSSSTHIENIHAYRWTSKTEPLPFVFSIVGDMTIPQVLQQARKRFRQPQLELKQVLQIQTIPETLTGIYALMGNQGKLSIGDIKLQMNVDGEVLLWSAGVPATLTTEEPIRLLCFE